MLSSNAQQKFWGLRQQVPDKMVQSIYRRGRFNRLSDKLHVWRLPWKEQFGPQIRVGVRSIERTFKDVTTQDGVLHNVTVHFKVFYDIRLATSHLQPILVENGETIIQNRTSGVLETTLRKFFRNIKSPQLRLQGVIENIEKKLRMTIARELKDFGLTVPNSVDSVYLANVLPPKRLQAARTETTSISETAAVFNQLNPQEVLQALMAIIYRDMGTGPMQIRSVNLPESMSPNARHLTDDSYRILRQPTGQIYAN